MFGLSAAVRVYLAKQPADMRKSFDGLAALASGSLCLTPSLASRSCIGTAMVWPSGPRDSSGSRSYCPTVGGQCARPAPQTTDRPRAPVPSSTQTDPGPCCAPCHGVVRAPGELGAITCVASE